MRILHFISSPSAGGAEVFVKDLSLAMVGSGHAVKIVFLNTAKEVERDEVFEAGYLRELSEANVGYSFISSGARSNPLKGWVSFRKLVAEFLPDIVHCHLYYSLLFSIFTRRVPVVYTHHSMGIRIPKVAFKTLSARVSAFVGISLAGTRLLESVPVSPVHRIDNAVSMSRVHKLRRRSGKITVVMVGSLREQKNYMLFLNALCYLRDMDFIVQIAGEGPERHRLLEAVARLKLDHKVLLLGNVADIAGLLSSADLFAMSSCSEGLPIALVEATATGLPVIVTNVGGCSEVVHSCQNGIVVDELSPIEYSAGLRRLIESSKTRDFYSKNARANVGRYEISKSCIAHLELYEDVLR